MRTRVADPMRTRVADPARLRAADPMRLREADPMRLILPLSSRERGGIRDIGRRSSSCCWFPSRTVPGELGRIDGAERAGTVCCSCNCLALTAKEATLRLARCFFLRPLAL